MCSACSLTWIFHILYSMAVASPQKMNMTAQKRTVSSNLEYFCNPMGRVVSVGIGEVCLTSLKNETTTPFSCSHFSAILDRLCCVSILSFSSLLPK